MDDENDEDQNCDDAKSIYIISAVHLQPKPLCPPLSACEETVNGGGNSSSGSPQGAAGIRGSVHKPLIIIIIIIIMGRDSSVDIATRYGLDGPGIESRWGRDFPHPSRPALEPTQPPI